MKLTLAQLVEMKREKYREQARLNNEYFAYSAHQYAARTRVDFVAVLDRHFSRVEKLA